MYRDLSFSLAAHVALIGALLALSATRQSARIPEVVRPVRLITYLEPPAAAPARPGRAVEPARRVAPPAAPRAAQPAPARTAPATAKPVTPVAIPKIAFPSAAPPPAARPRPAPRPAAPQAEPPLSDRLARRLAAPAPAPPAATKPEAPRIASLPRPEEATPPRPSPVAAPAAAGAAVPPGGPVEAVGYFPHTWYLNALLARVDESWTPPSDFWVGAGSVAALVSFRINRDGRISRVSLKQSSGHARFDRSALAAIQRLAHVHALPEQYAEESLDVVIRMHNEE